MPQIPVAFCPGVFIALIFGWRKNSMEQLSGLTLFKLKGVAVKVHVSLLFLLLYVVLVATASFPLVVNSSGIDIGTITGSPFLWAVIFALALLVSIFLHEFSHVLVAQGHGHKVSGVTFMMLGGVSQLEKMPEEPSTEFKVAIIGPIVSLAIAGILFWIRGITPSANLAFFCYWVGQTNLVLGIFNLLPAFPTDGGRVLRAALVTKFGRLHGTQIAVKVSRVFAWIFGIIGFLQFNLLLILVAFFVYSAAKSELFVLLGQTVLKGMTAKDAMKPVTAISAESSLSFAADEMTKTQRLLLPVNLENGFSLISAEQIQQMPRPLWQKMQIKDLARTPAKVIDLNSALDEVWQTSLMTSHGGICVVDQNQLVGIIETADLIKLIELKQLTEGNLRSSSLDRYSTKFRPSYP